MARYRIIDTAAWPRRDHFTFYRQFANPSFNLCVPIEAQRLYECAKDRRVSFFQLALYALLRAANGVPQLRQRVRDGEVINGQSDDARVQGVRRFIEMIGDNPRLTATALQTVGIKGWDGFTLALVNG